MEVIEAIIALRADVAAVDDDDENVIGRYIAEWVIYYTQ